jgi:hypothetical protein
MLLHAWVDVFCIGWVGFGKKTGSFDEERNSKPILEKNFFET